MIELDDVIVMMKILIIGYIKSFCTLGTDIYRYAVY